MLDFYTFLSATTIFGQRFEYSDLAVVGLLVILEGVLSIDNALVLGLLAKRLPEHQRKRALTYGLFGAFFFRVVAICLASLLLQWTFVKFLGGGYLFYIAVRHIFFESQEEGGEKIQLDDQGNPVLTDAEGHDLTRAQEDLEIKERVPLPMEPRRAGKHFWYTVAVIELTDVAFAVDSILAAMALAGSKQDKLWVVISGGILGVILMRFAAIVFIRLLEKFPRFELAAYLLVAIIGIKLLADWGCNSDWSFDQMPRVSQSLGSWKESFVSLEKERRETIHSYEDWLDKNWFLKMPPHAEHHEPQPGEIAMPAPVPHLLDFHNWRRPEFMTFWVLMAGCFGVGFIPPKKHEPKEPESAKQKDAK